jgi:hypothetical protein
MCHRLLFHLSVFFRGFPFYLPFITWVMTWWEIPNGLTGTSYSLPSQHYCSGLISDMDAELRGGRVGQDMLANWASIIVKSAQYGEGRVT